MNEYNSIIKFQYPLQRLHDEINANTANMKIVHNKWYSSYRIDNKYCIKSNIGSTDHFNLLLIYIVMEINRT